MRGGCENILTICFVQSQSCLTFQYFSTSLAASPMSRPVMIPAIKRDGEIKRATPAVFVTKYATSICPILWDTPPAMLTPKMLKLSGCFSRHITEKLIMAPARL